MKRNDNKKKTKPKSLQAKKRRTVCRQNQNRILSNQALSLISDGDGEKAVSLLMEVISSLQSDNERLLIFLNASNRMRFGRKAEKLTAEELGQLTLALGGTKEEAKKTSPQLPLNSNDGAKLEVPEEENITEPKKSTKRPHLGRNPLDPSLPRKFETILVPEDERSCIHCGCEMRTIDYDTSETVRFIPAQIEVHVTRREKIACKSCKQDIVSAPNGQLVSRPKEKSRVDVSLLAHLLESKCDDGMPIYRIQEQLSRIGFHVPVNTLYDYWIYAAESLYPISQAVLSEILSEPIVALDDTALHWLDTDCNRTRKRGHLWCFMGESPLVAFDFTEDWSATTIQPWIDNISGFIQCDDYKGYSAKVTRGSRERCSLVDPTKRLGCWMHIRRRFYQAFKAGDKQAIIPLAMIRDLYELEARFKKEGLTPDKRFFQRQHMSLPRVAKFYDWVEEQVKETLPLTYMGRALKYAMHQKDFAVRCFSDGRFELDTGRVERQIREPVIGRKNYLFSGSAKGAQMLAAVYTLVCSCRSLGISTRAYLTDILTRVHGGFPLRQVNDLRPDIWARSQGLISSGQSKVQ